MKDINVDEPVRYNVKNIPIDFMHNQESIVPLIQQITQCRETQDEVDLVYNNICELILNEMNDKLPKLSQSPPKHKHRRYKPKKPFWNEELAAQFADVVEKEKNLKKCTLRFLKRGLRQQFKQARDSFDKMYRRAERQYKRGQMTDIESICTTDPTRFWESLKKLGPHKHTTIPMEVYAENDEIVCDKEVVLDTWKNEFKKLYNDGARQNQDPN